MRREVPKDSLQSKFEEYIRIWVAEKQRAERLNDYKDYLWFLKETRKEFNKIYAGMKNEAWITFMEELLHFVSCEIKKIRIKYKESNET